MRRLYLLDPPDPGPAWRPFTGARPLAELRAGAWRVRERWEAAVGLTATAILADHAAGFAELDHPPVRPVGPVTGPAVIASSTFVPARRALDPGPPGRLTDRATGRTVAWVVGDGDSWHRPHDEGPAGVLDGIGLDGVPDLVAALDTLLDADCREFTAAPADPIPGGSIVLGEPSLVVCLGAAVEPGVVFDTRGGAIVLTEGSGVRSGTRLEGPLYLGPGTHVLGGQIRHSAIGPACRVHGEVAHVVMLGYSNKSHDGFVGHSVLGHWVNLGAGTITSNLKNTYGPIRLELPEGRRDTGRQFLGSLIGDHVKTAIGTRLDTGTVIGAGANLFGPGPVPRYVPPFAWGGAGPARLELDGFLRIAGRVLPRRGVELTPEREAGLRALYHRQVR